MKFSISMGTLSALASLLIAPQVVVAEEEATTPVKTEPEVICFNSDRVRNFDGLSDDYLYIEVNSKERFLLNMKNKCFGLKSAQVFAFKDTMRRVCSNDSFTEIVVSDMGRPTTCRINTFERVENKDAAKALVAERKQAKDSE